MESSFSTIRKQQEGSSAALRMDEHRTMLLALIDEGLHPELCRLYLASLAEDAGMQIPAPSQSYENSKGQAAGNRRRSTMPPQRGNTMVNNPGGVNNNNAGNQGVKRNSSVSTNSVQQGQQVAVQNLHGDVQGGSAKVLRRQNDGQKKTYDESLKNQA